MNEYSKFICQKAKARGIKCEKIDPKGNFLVMKNGDKSYIVSGGVLSVKTPASVYLLTENKNVAYHFLKKNHFPVLPQIKTKSFEEAKEFMHKHKVVVVKPLNQKQGRGISVNLKTIKALKRAWTIASKYGNYKIVEKYYTGIDHRVLLVDYQYFFAAKRFPAYVIGDGEHNLKELIELKNSTKIRGKRKKQIKIDKALKLHFELNKLTLDMVPAKNEKVIVRGTANLHTGGETQDITDELTDEVKQEVIRLAKLLQLQILAVDYLADDLAKKRNIIEMNSGPGYLMHHFPTYGQKRDPLSKILDVIFGKK